MEENSPFIRLGDVSQSSNSTRSGINSHNWGFEGKVSEVSGEFSRGSRRSIQEPPAVIESPPLVLLCASSASVARDVAVRVEVSRLDPDRRLFGYPAIAISPLRLDF